MKIQKKENPWKNNGSKNEPSYFFTPPKTWTAEKINFEKIEILNKIKDLKNFKNIDEDWLFEINKLPSIIFSILIDELTKGNSIAHINFSNWPTKGSVLICLTEKFHEINKNKKGTKWMKLNDPHYWDEEISQINKGIEYLLIN